MMCITVLFRLSSIRGLRVAATSILCTAAHGVWLEARDMGHRATM